MIDLKREMERELGLIDAPDLWGRIQAEASNGDAMVLDGPAVRYGRRRSVWLAVAAVLVLLVVAGAVILLDADQPVETVDTPSPTSLPVRHMPGNGPSPAGEYGWEGGPGDSTGMHWVTCDGSGCEAEEAAAIWFEVGPGCLAPIDNRQGEPVRIAGLDGTVIEPYLPPRGFVFKGDEITRGYALSVEAQTLCVFLTWHPSTSEEELATAAEIVESIQAQSLGDRVRITFALPSGWDVG